VIVSASLSAIPPSGGHIRNRAKPSLYENEPIARRGSTACLSPIWGTAEFIFPAMIGSRCGDEHLRNHLGTLKSLEPLKVSILTKEKYPIGFVHTDKMEKKD